MLSGLLVDVLAPRWTASGLRLFAGLTWLGEAVWFVVGLFVPEFRFYW